MLSSAEHSVFWRKRSQFIDSVCILHIYIISILLLVENSNSTVKEDKVVIIKQDTKKINLIGQMASKITILILLQTVVCSLH